jgi:hypothetical protein
MKIGPLFASNSGTTVAGTESIDLAGHVQIQFRIIDSTGRMSIEFSLPCSASQYVSFFTSRMRSRTVHFNLKAPLVTMCSGFTQSG